MFVSEYWIRGAYGQLPLGSASVLVGRSPDCDIVIQDERVSRHHALFRVTSKGAEVLPFDRQPVTVNGIDRNERTELHGGDEVEFAGQRFTVVEASAMPSPRSSVTWGVESFAGALFRVAHRPFRIGGASDDHLILPAWPPTAVLLHQVGDTLTLEALREGIRCGDVLSSGACVPLVVGRSFGFGDHALRVVTFLSDPAAATLPPPPVPLPTRAELSLMPRGARLTLHFGTETHVVQLSDRRSDLVATLLQPPAPFEPGDPLPNDLLLRRIWPTEERGPEDLTTLVFRARRDLMRAGIDGANLIERQAGTVRFGLAPDAHVKITP